jgi:hypothetical protein
MPGLSFFLLLILVIAINLLWYTIKSILSENGYKVSYWHSHFRDLSNFYDLIQKTQDDQSKMKYQKMFWGLIVLFLSFIPSAILTMN